MINSYLQNESERDTLIRAFENISAILELSKHTDIKKSIRHEELVRAQSIIEIILFSMNENNELSTILETALLKTTFDITQSIAGEKVDFTDHIGFFKLIVSGLILKKS